MTVTQEDMERGLRALGLGERTHLLAHSSLKAFGGVEGGPMTVVQALVETVSTVMMPAYTSERTAVWDASGLFEGNAYRPEPPPDTAPAPFSYDTPIDREIGIIPETFRTAYPVRRSGHPLLSFVAYGELAERLAGAGGETNQVEPIRRLMEAGGEVLLIGVTHTASTAVHLAELLAGRRLFIRHALTDEGAKAVISGGCSEAFDELQPHVARLERRTTVGDATLRRYRLRPYVEAARELIEDYPYALLCDCERCSAYKDQVSV